MFRRTGFVLLTFSLSWIASSAGVAQFWEVDNRMLTPTSQLDAGVGEAVGIGDFDGDGIYDFVYGAPEWDSPEGVNVGRWWFVRGSPDRSLASMGSFYFTGVIAGRGAWALAAGDFDDDGRDEVAIGRPNADVEQGGHTYWMSGEVLISEYDSGSGWTSPQMLTEPDISSYAGFGGTLSIGDFNADGIEDLVVAATQWPEDVEFAYGKVYVFYGSAAGLRTDNYQGFAAGVGGVAGTPGGFLGAALATGDFDGDGFDDLAMAAPGRNSGAYENGEVHVLYGSAAGLTTVGQQLLGEYDFGGDPEDWEQFGSALAAANFDEAGIWCLLNPCFDDLVIGVHGHSVLGQGSAGMAWVAYGSALGIDPAAAFLLSQDAQAGTPEVLDHFGKALAAGHADGRFPAFNRHADLVVGIPGEDISITNEGYVQLFFGSSAGLDGGQQEQSFNQKAGFDCSPPVPGDEFGSVMALGDIDGDGWGDLIVGMPNKGLGGAIQVLYGALFADGFESGGQGNW